MPFFSGAYNFQIYGANMTDNSNNTNVGRDYIAGHRVGGNYNAGDNNVGGDRVNAPSNPNAFGSHSTASDRNPARDRDPAGNNPATGAHAGGDYVGGHHVGGNYNEGDGNVGGDYIATGNLTPQRPALVPDISSAGTIPNTYNHTLDPEKQQPEEKERKPPSGLTFLFYNLYTLFLLRIPNIYLSRIERLGGQAELAQQEIISMAFRMDWPNPSSNRSSGKYKNGKAFLEYVSELERGIRGDAGSSLLPVPFLSLGNKWKDFVEHLLREWQTLNVVSALLIPGILPIFNISGAGNNPITRYLAFWSLISALMSLLYGCLFIIQFSQMKKTIIGIELLQVTFRDDSIAFWAVDIMLALPAIWLAWSILAYIACIMSFLWLAGPVPPVSFDVPISMVLGFRIFLSVVLGIGATFTIFIFYTFKRYGRSLDASIAEQLENVIIRARNDPLPHSTAATSSEA